MWGGGGAGGGGAPPPVWFFLEGKPPPPPPVKRYCFCNNDGGFDMLYEYHCDEARMLSIGTMGFGGKRETVYQDLPLINTSFLHQHDHQQQLQMYCSYSPRNAIDI